LELKGITLISLYTVGWYIAVHSNMPIKNLEESGSDLYMYKQIKQ